MRRRKLYIEFQNNITDSNYGIHTIAEYFLQSLEPFHHADDSSSLPLPNPIHYHSQPVGRLLPTGWDRFCPTTLQHKYKLTFAYTGAARICCTTSLMASFSSGLLQLDSICFITFYFSYNFLVVQTSNYRYILRSELKNLTYIIVFFPISDFAKARLVWPSAVYLVSLEG